MHKKQNKLPFYFSLFSAIIFAICIIYILAQPNALENVSFSSPTPTLTPAPTSLPTATPTPIKEFEVQIEKNEIKILNLGEVVHTQKYKTYSDQQTISAKSDNILRYEDYIVFEVTTLLINCELADNTDCVEGLSAIIADAKNYTGLWKYDIKTKKLAPLYLLSKFGYKFINVKNIKKEENTENIIVQTEVNNQPNDKFTEVTYTINSKTGIFIK